MLDTNVNKILWASVATGVVAVLGLTTTSLFPAAFEIGNRSLISVINDFVSDKNYEQGDDIAGVSKADVRDGSKVVDTGIQSMAVKIRDAKSGQSAVWIAISQNSDGGYTINSAGTTKETDNGSAIFGGDLTIPNSVYGRSITKIDNGVFENATFAGELMLPRDLQYVGERAFKNSVFTGNLVLPTEMWGIQNAAFENSKFTGDIKLPKNLTIIGSYTFKNSVFTGSLKLPKSTILLNEGAFMASQFTGTLDLPDGLTRISHYALMNSRFTGDMIMPDSVDFFGGQAFQNSQFNGELHISNKLDDMYAQNFGNSNFNKVSGGNQLKRIIKIKEYAADDEEDLTLVRGVVVRGVEYKTAPELLLQR